MSKIMVLDDDRDILDMLETVLTFNRFDVDTISRWQRLDERLETFQPDLLLLDVSLGGADGREICKRLKNADKTKDLPIILFSANVQMEQFVKECQAQDFIAKPFDLQVLVDTITKHLN